MLTAFTNPVVLIVAMLALCIATLATNIAANVVSPANDFAHLAPKKISFRTGGFITGIIGVLMIAVEAGGRSQRLHLHLADRLQRPARPHRRHHDRGLLRPSRRHLELDELYRTNGIYRYSKGFSLAALAAFVLAVLPNLPGFLAHIKVVDGASVPDWLEPSISRPGSSASASPSCSTSSSRKLSPVKITTTA